MMRFHEQHLIEDSEVSFPQHRVRRLGSASSFSSLASSISDMSEDFTWSESPLPQSPLSPSPPRKFVGRKRTIFSKYWEKAGTPMAFRPDDNMGTVPEDASLVAPPSLVAATSTSSSSCSPISSRRSIFCAQECAVPPLLLLQSQHSPPLHRTQRLVKSLVSLESPDSPQSPRRRSCLRQGRFSSSDCDIIPDDAASISDHTASSSQNTVTFHHQVEVTVYPNPSEVHAEAGWTNFFAT
jgi:hypothetical protein